MASMKESVGNIQYANAMPKTYKDSIIAVVTGYLGCDSWQERLKYADGDQRFSQKNRGRPLWKKTVLPQRVGLPEDVILFRDCRRYACLASEMEVF